MTTWPDNPGARHLVRVVAFIAVLWLLGMVSGCATTQQLQPVKVPVPVECKEAVPDRPTMATDVLVAGVALDRAVAAMQAEIEVREGYEVRLRTALVACTRAVAGDVEGRRGR